MPSINLVSQTDHQINDKIMKFIQIQNKRINLDNVLHYEPCDLKLGGDSTTLQYRITMYYIGAENRYTFDFIFKDEKSRNDALNALDSTTSPYRFANV